MKKIFLFLFLLLWFTQSFAITATDSLKKLPTNFKWHCYEYYNKIDKIIVWNNLWETYKIKLSKSEDVVFTQFGFILPYKYYSDSKNSYSFKSDLWITNEKITDYNKNTYIELHSINKNEIILSFDEILEKNNFNFVFDYSTNNYTPSYYISVDKNTWNLVKKEDLENFSFKYLKIVFLSNTKESFLENIKIYELYFPKKSDTFLVKSFNNSDIEIYSKFNCKDKDFDILSSNYNNFSINKDTKTIELTKEINPKYNVYSKIDTDNDWVEDDLDNCKNIYNPDQSDINGDGVWDMCSDDDKDWIIWYYDNCPNVYNPDQKDINRNGIWDVCEFDKDKDWVFDSIDNCINVFNPDQSDDDKDWIWNACDNCKSYNPSQIDANNNGIWDICEEIEKNLRENDRDKDGIIDFNDNCINVYNPDQADDDKDGIWNACDNCKNIQNKDQLDFDKNWIWDICEDSDGDWIDWLVDNCINIANPDQKDSDNDWVWDLCEDDDGDNILFAKDNCPFVYNPDQKDVDNDWIGDACDEKDNRFIESNSNFFIILIIFITLVFFYWIYKMLKKLK